MQVKGAYAWDVDGNKYIDYVGSWGPAIVGHADDEVLAVLAEVAAKGKLAAGSDPAYEAEGLTALRGMMYRHQLRRSLGVRERAGQDGDRRRALGRDGALHQLR